MRKSCAPTRLRLASNSNVKKDINENMSLPGANDENSGVSETAVKSNVSGVLRSTEDIINLISGIQNQNKGGLSKDKDGRSVHPILNEECSVEPHSINKRLHTLSKASIYAESEDNVTAKENVFSATIKHAISDEEFDDEDPDDNDMKKNPSVGPKYSIRSQSPSTNKRLCIDPETSICEDTEANSELNLTPDDIRVLNSSGKKLQPSKNPLYFSVLWCKKSTRKHKKWEGDAILIVKGCSAVLKDMEGKAMAQGIGYKIKEVTGLEDGSRFFIGGKECEIQSVVSEEDYTSGKCFTEC